MLFFVPARWVHTGTARAWLAIVGLPRGICKARGGIGFSRQAWPG